MTFRRTETWFLARAFRLLKQELVSIEGVLAYSDPHPRSTAAGELVFLGHLGIAYQAGNARYLGRSKKGTVILDADARTVSARSLSKLRNDERGARGVYEQLLRAGAPPLRSGESSRAYVERALASGPFRKIEHPGNHVYGWSFDGASKCCLDSEPYPKREPFADAQSRSDRHVRHGPLRRGAAPAGLTGSVGHAPRAAHASLSARNAPALSRRLPPAPVREGPHRICPADDRRRGAPLARREEGAWLPPCDRRATKPAGMDRRRGRAGKSGAGPDPRGPFLGHLGAPHGCVGDAEKHNKKLPTHDIFDVQERQNSGPFWNKVGGAFENRDGSHSVLIYQPGLPDSKALQLRAIDRKKRPLKAGADAGKSPTHELFDVLERDNGEKDWKRVGAGFTNKDGSLSLIVDNGDREGPKARFQMRTAKPKPAAAPRPAA